MFRNYLSVVMLVSGALALSVVAVAQQSPTEAPTGFDTPTSAQTPGSQSVSNGIEEPPGDTYPLDQRTFEQDRDDRLRPAKSQGLLSAKSYDKRAWNEYKKGEITQALADYNKSISINPRLAMAYYGRGLAFYASGRCDKAIADFNHAIAINSRLAEAYNVRGLCWFGAGNVEQAIADYSTALEIDPALSWAYYNRGIARTAGGDLKGAIADYSERIDFVPRDVSAYAKRGLVRLMLHQEREAKKDFNTCLKLDARLTATRRGYPRLCSTFISSILTR